MSNDNYVNDLTPLEAALIYARSGRLVLPLIPQQKRPYVKWSVESLPLGHVPSEETIRDWWSRWPDAGVGMRTDGLLVFDVDLPLGPSSFKTLKERIGPLPATKTIFSGSGGSQRLYRLPDETAQRIPQAQGIFGLPNIDTRVGTKGIIALPPTLHHSGFRYRWRRAATPTADLPRAYVMSQMPPPRRRPTATSEPIAAPNSTPLGKRILQAEVAALRLSVAAGGPRTLPLGQIAGRMGQLVYRGDLNEDEATTALLSLGDELGLPDRKAHKEVLGGIRWGLDNPRPDREST